MPTPTYTPLATVTLGASASSVTFSSIPATYRDLIIVINGTLSQSNLVGLRFNSTSTNYSTVLMRGNGTNAISATDSVTYIPIWQTGDPVSGVGRVSIMDYSATDKHKTCLVRGDTNTNTTEAHAARWAVTDAITSVEVRTILTGNFNSGFTFSLYGVIA